ncbi:MAG TPA: hypothetical protein VFJ01_05470, partial [Oleiagrimonas sp.]|nr:hypothetical protein [Oleiagrimonas sp.]
MRTISRLMAVAIVGLALVGCASNQALNVVAQPTDLSGYWSANGGGHTISWFIRADGTGVHCETSNGQLGVQPLVVDIKLANGKAYLNHTYTLSRTGP